MVLSTFFPLSRISILATDLDEKVIEKAKIGFYDERSLQEMPVSMKNKYFQQRGTGYLLDKKIKKTVVFQKHNLLSDSFPKNVDLIVCRNVLIYFTDEAKHALYEKFSRALAPGGILFVGSTEQVFTPQKYGFETADTFFYRKVKTI
jgi:chemotaxis protein methyltransferase CheR